MKKLVYSALAVATFLLIANTAFAQTRVAVDPGFSVNNYKHPNKAKQAKAQQVAPEGASANAIVESRQGNRFSNTPKYASRPGSRVLLDTGIRSGNVPEPLRFAPPLQNTSQSCYVQGRGAPVRH